MAIDYNALKTEIQTDPLTFGYLTAGTGGNDEAIAVLLNTVRVGAKVNQGLIAPALVVGCIVYTEWATVAAELRQYIQMTLQDAVDVNNTNVKAAYQAAFGAGTTTRANFVKLLQRDASRAESLWGAGTIIMAADVAKALRG